MTSNSDLPTISVLLIDGNERDRTNYTEQLKRSSSNYEILEAADGQTALHLYHSRRIDCVILELDLPDQLAFRMLAQLVPMASRPNIAVIILTHHVDPQVRGLALKNGAYDYFVKSHTSGDDLDKAIQQAVALVGLLPKEGSHRHHRTHLSRGSVVQDHYNVSSKLEGGSIPSQATGGKDRPSIPQ